MNQAVYFHRLGAPMEEDTLVYERPENPEWGFDATVTDDGAHLVITVWKGTDDRYQIVHQDLTDPDAQPQMLIEGFDHDYTLVGNIGSELFFRTNEDAPRNRLIAIDVNNPEPQNWREVIPQATDVLDGVNLVGGKIIMDYLQDAQTVVKIFDLDGQSIRHGRSAGYRHSVGIRRQVRRPGNVLYLYKLQYADHRQPAGYRDR